MPKIFRKKEKNGKDTTAVSYKTKHISQSKSKKFKEVEITVNIDSADLVNSDVNNVKIKIVEDNESYKKNKKLNAKQFRAELKRKSKPVKKKNLASIDPKEFISHKKLEKSARGEKIVEEEVTKVVKFANKTYRAVSRNATESALTNLYSGRPRSIEAQKSSVALRKTVSSGIVDTQSSDIAPLIQRKREILAKKINTVKLKASILPNQKIELVLEDKKGFEKPTKIPPASTRPQLKPLRLENPSTGIDFFRKISDLSHVIIATVTKPKKGEHVISVARNSKVVSGCIISKRVVSQYPALDSFISVGEYRFPPDSDVINLGFRTSTSNPCVYRFKPVSENNVMPHVVDRTVSGDNPITPIPSPTCYQDGDNVKIIFSKIPISAKKLRITETSLIYNTKRTPFHNDFKNETITIPINTAKNDLYRYDMFQSDKYGLETRIASIVKEIYGKQVDNASFGASALNTISVDGSLSHHISFDIAFPKPWFPKADDSLETPSDSMRNAASFDRNMAKVKITRHSLRKYRKEEIGTFILNQNIDNTSKINTIPVEFKPPKTLSVSLLINDAFAAANNITKISENDIYYYEIRPMFYPLAVEFSFLAIPEKIKKPGENGKMDYEYHPYVFDNPKGRETGAYSGINNLNREQLELYSLSSISKILQSSPPADPIKQPTISGFEIATEPFGHYCIILKFDVSPRLLEMCDYWQLHVAPSSTGISFIADKLEINSPISEYIDFNSPKLATNEVRYVLEGIGYDESSIVLSTPFDIKFSEDLIIKHLKMEDERK